MDHKLQTQGYTTFLNRTEKRLYGSQVVSHQLEETQLPINKSSRSDYLEKKLNNFEKKLEEFAGEERKRDLNLVDTLAKLKGSIAYKNEIYRSKIEKKAAEFVEFYQNHTGAVQNEIRDRKTVENNVLNRLDDKYMALRHEIQNIASDRQTDLESLQKALDVDLPRLNDRLITEGRNTEDFIEDLKDRYATDVKVFKSGLEDEIKANDEHDRAVYNMLEEINEKMKEQINEEKALRRKCEENLLGLLEDACKKINAIN